MRTLCKSRGMTRLHPPMSAPRDLWPFEVPLSRSSTSALALQKRRTKGKTSLAVWPVQLQSSGPKRTDIRCFEQMESPWKRGWPFPLPSSEMIINYNRSQFGFYSLRMVLGSRVHFQGWSYVRSSQLVFFLQLHRIAVHHACG